MKIIPPLKQNCNLEGVQKNTGANIEEAVRLALQGVVGAYAIVVASMEEPDKLVVAKLSSPMVIGYGDNEFYVASDGSPLVEYTKKVSYIEDGQIATLHKNGEIALKSIKDKTNLTVKLGGVEEFEQSFLNAKRIVFVACGTSWHSALIGEYLIEDLARIQVEVEYASEFRYRNPIITEDDIVIAISQSGETADTKAALELAKKRGALTYGICNVVGSAISRMTDAGSYTHAGPEIGVASTKAFTTQVTILTMMALQLAHKKGTLSKTVYHQYISELEQISEKIKIILKLDKRIKQIANIFKDSTNFLYLGRGYNFPVALEGALKLKEISYVHAEGYPAAEMKHGPIALIDENMPILVVATNVEHYEKVLSNIEEVKTRKGRIIAIVNEGDTEISKLAEFVIPIPKTSEPFTPLLSVIPLQLLSYHMAVLRGCDVDQPRNLAKSVTVE